MDYKNINKNDPKIRTALLNTYNSKCFYLHVPLSYDEMDIDHIIPENIAENAEELERYLRELELPEDFPLNCFQNLVPTTRAENRRKSGNLFNVNNARYYLSMTHQSLEKFEKELIIADKRAKDSKLRQTIDMLTNEAPFYEEIVDIKENHCVFSKKHVRLESCLPRYPYLTGSCLITFKSVLLRDCMITFGHKEIVTTLFAGVDSGSSYEMRGLYVGTYQSKHFVQLGNNRFALTAEELEELCWAVDKLESVYIKKVIDIESIYGIRYFSKSPYNDSRFRLLRITRGLWDQLIDFSEIFDTSKGSSKWHIFNFSYNSLKVFGDGKNENIAPGYHAIIYAENIERPGELSSGSSENEIWLSWEAIEYLQKGIVDDYSDNNLWSAQKTHDWLIGELIPFVLYFNKKRNNWLPLKPRESVSKYFSMKFDSELYCASGCDSYNFYINNPYSTEDCLQLIGMLQEHFHLEHNIYLKCSDVKPLCEIIIDYLKLDPLKCYDYVLGSLSNSGARYREQLVEELEDYIENLQDGDCSSSEIDYKIRGLLEIIEKGNLSIDKAETASLSYSLKGLCRVMQKNIDTRRIAKY